MSIPAVSERYRWSVAWVLMVVYTLNFMDRQVLSVLLPQIQAEMHIPDALAGLLHGTAFALFYVTLALPIARWADVGNRVRIIAVSTVIWGVMTALCGAARTFPMLFLARVGVGVGEAGCSPAAYSLLSAYFPPEKRSTAMAIYGSGISIGGALGLGLGGVLAQSLGWRPVFWIFAIPSVLAGLLVALWIREPARDAGPRPPSTPILQVVRELWALRAFRHATAATSLLAFAGFASSAWFPSFLVRSHGMPVAWVGLGLAATTLFCAAPAALVAGPIADRLARRDRRAQMWLPAVLKTMAAPFSLAVFLLPAGTVALFGHSFPTYVLVVLLAAVPAAASASYIGPVLAAIQTLVPERTRATTIALFLFCTNLVGMGAGPFVIGLVSDVLNARFGAEALRWSLLVTIAANLWAAFHYWRAGVWLPRELDSRGRWNVFRSEGVRSAP